MLLAGCGETQPNQLVVAIGGSAARGGSDAAGSSGYAAVPIPMPMPCPADMNPPPAPPSSVAGDITAVVPSNGCGRDYPCGETIVKRTLQTTGTKASDCADLLNGKHVCGDWSVERDFRVYLPAGYDSKKPYPLVIEAPGCGGNGGNVYTLPNVKDQAIRIGVSPGPASTGHALVPSQGCFDDHEGDDSIDWVFYERLYDRLNDELCFDRQRVFAVGDNSGGTFANELGCKYAGDIVRPVRGVLVNAGDLPAEPQYAPTCSNAPLAGMWIHDLPNLNIPFEGLKRAVSRAMKLAHCVGGDYDHAQLVDFPVAGQPDDTCKYIVGCDELYPQVVCPLPNVSRTPNSHLADPGFSKFIQLFGMGPFISSP